MRICVLAVSGIHARKACCPGCRGVRASAAPRARRPASAPIRTRCCVTCSVSRRMPSPTCTERELLAEPTNQTTRGGNPMSSITLNQANRVLRATLKKAADLNIKVSAAVVDDGGRLIAFQRMDGAIWASAYGSQGKAVASAAFGRPSGEMAERADQPTPRGIAAAEGGHMIMGQGAVPIVRNGVVEGACGVGGGTSQQDEDCARAGVEQL